MKKTFLLLLFSVALTDCAPGQQHTFTVTMPAVTTSASATRLLVSASRDVSPPKSYDGFNCFALNVNGPGIARDVRASSFCTGPGVGMGKLGGTAPFSGGSVSVSAPEGRARTVQLVGMMTADGTCPTFDQFGDYVKKVGPPRTFVLGQTTTDLLTDVAISIQAKYDPTKPVEIFGDCSATSSSSSSIPQFNALPVYVPSGGAATFSLSTTPPVSDTVVLSAYSDSVCSVPSTLAALSAPPAALSSGLAVISAAVALTASLETQLYIKATLQGSGVSACSPSPIYAGYRFLPSYGQVHTGAPGAAGASGTNQNDVVNAVAVDANGRVYLVGKSSGTNSAGPFQLAIWRYNPDGSKDTTFGSGGHNYVLGGTNGAAGGTGSFLDDEGLAAAFDGKGRLVVVGFSSRGSTTGVALAVWRYLQSGNLDASFNGTGIFTSSTGTNAATGCGGSSCHEEGHAIAFDSVGNIVIAGQSNNSLTHQFAVWRLTEAGAYDSAFNSNGRYTYNSGSTGFSGTTSSLINDLAQAVAVDAADNIVATGYTKNSSVGTQMLVARILKSGSLDTANFAGGLGYYTTITGIVDSASASVMDDEAKAVQIDGAGKIVVAGRTRKISGDTELFATRFDKFGALDTGFATGGRYFSEAASKGLAGAGPGAEIDIATTLRVGPLGGMIIGGTSRSALATTDAVLVKLTPAGVLDSSFGTGGLVDLKTASVAGGTGANWVDTINSCVIDLGSRIVCGGTSQSSTPGLEAAAWRFMLDGTLNN